MAISDKWNVGTTRLLLLVEDHNDKKERNSRPCGVSNDIQCIKNYKHEILHFSKINKSHF